jgi:Tol biopolymer transport system component
MKWAAAILAAFFGGVVHAQVTQRESLSSTGTESPGGSWIPAVSADGRYVAFQCWGTGLVPNDANGVQDIFVRDRLTGQTTIESVDSNGVQANDASHWPAITPDGRFLAFMSYASNLVPGDTNGVPDEFVRDRLTGQVTRVSVSSSGAQGNGMCYPPVISADGRWVAFESVASTLVPGDTNATSDLFLHDRATGQTTRVSVGWSGAQANGHSGLPSMSPDGRFLAFTSAASNLVPFDLNGVQDVFVLDRLTGVTRLASTDSHGVQGDQMSDQPSISADGRQVAFASDATNLVLNDFNISMDVFVHDMKTGETTRVSVSSNGAEGDDDSEIPSISADGLFVVFSGRAATLVPGDTNQTWDVFLHDRHDSLTTRASVSSSGAEADAQSSGGEISSDGRFVVFASVATNLAGVDTNGTLDIYSRDVNASGFTSDCEPGANGVIGCPCGNAPATPGRGCENSAGTGGAALFAGGIAYLSMDGLYFQTYDERPSAPSILLQGDAEIAAGAVFGQGVRCVGGVLQRLFVKPASFGSITAPDFGLGEPSVSARSASLGFPIQPGQSRFYCVYYRDPIVLGSCSSSATFNTTTGGRVSWQP